MKRFFVVCLCLAISALQATNAAALPVSLDQRVGAVPTQPGDGLMGEYYRWPSADIQNIYQVRSLISEPPDATFKLLKTEFPWTRHNGGGSVEDFIGDSVTNIVGSVQASPAFSYYRMTGYIAIDASMDLDSVASGIQARFDFISDDGHLITIGDAVGGDPIEGGAKPFKSSDFEFVQEGLYPITLEYFEEFGDAHYLLRGYQPNASLLTTARLYTVPEPQTALMIIGYGLLVLSPVRRKRRAGLR